MKDKKNKLKWISVEDKLPEQGEIVLVHRGNDLSYPISIGAYGFFKDGIWGEREDDNWNVTHWMPLPEPPQNTAQKEKLILDAMAEVAELKGKYETLKSEYEYLKKLIDRTIDNNKYKPTTEIVDFIVKSNKEFCEETLKRLKTAQAEGK